MAGVHEWSPDDLNEVIHHDFETGDEATIYCKRCKKQIVTVEKKEDGDLKYTPHVKEAIIYEVNPEYIKKYGRESDFKRFQEENK